MNGKNFLTNHTYDIRKLLGIILIVFLALTVKVHFIGETDEVVQFDYLTQTA
jgi:hypothetical protein